MFEGGGGTSGAENFKGQAADWRLFNIALSARQIRTLASGYEQPMGEQGTEITRFTMQTFKGVAHPDGVSLSDASLTLPNEYEGAGEDLVLESRPYARADGLTPFGYRVSSESMLDLYLDVYISVEAHIKL